MCGIIGVHLSDANKQAYPYILNGLTILQHRGQDAAGIHTVAQTQNGDAAITHKYKNVGKVDKVFHQDMSDILVGNYGIGHIRYCTAGSLNIKSAQPLITNTTIQPTKLIYSAPLGESSNTYRYASGVLRNISLVHNGNLTNTAELIELLRQNNIEVSGTESDSEILLQLFSFRLGCLLNVDGGSTATATPAQIQNDTVFYAINYVMNLCRGSFSAIIMIPGFGLVVFRDPRGIRPLCFGKSKNLSNQEEYIFASESVAVQSLGFEFIRDVAPGECIISRQSDNGNSIYSKLFDIDGSNPTPCPCPCLFEYIYFARPESIIDGILVYQARKNMGEALANKILRDHPGLSETIDVVMPVPDSARISALRASYILQKPYCEGLIKNAYVGRTFIMPSQSERKKHLKMKLNTIDQEFRDKTVLIIDDSIVRGNTSMQIVESIRRAGAKQIIFASIAPPVRFPNVYGIAIPTSHELIAYDKTEREICQILGADELIYNDLDAVVEACRKLCPAILGFEVSCFLG
jgi:amidophosphoribosyltransferase